MALAVGRVLSGDKTSDKTAFYEIVRTEKGQLTLESRWTADSQMLGGYTCLMVIESGGKQYLVGYSREKSEADAYEILLEKPYFSSVESRLSFDPGWDSLEPFFLGNRQYITCYKRTTGQFNFFEVNEDLSLSKPFRFIHSREPGTSIGFTMVKPIVCLGMVYIMGYNFETGNAVIYSLNVTSRSSSPDVPPLNLKYVWQRSWSPGWTRFAFFTLGGENFFLKTNTMYPNVNIDHVCDEPSDGAVPVATRMKLENAQNLKMCQSFSLGGDQYVVAYSGDGLTSFYKIRGDCQGLVSVGSSRAVEESDHIIPVTSVETRGLLFYRG